MGARAILVAATVVALIGLGLLARLAFAPGGSGDLTFGGNYSSDTDLRVANRTIEGGHVRVGYSLDVFFRSAEPATLRCGLVDTSGTLEFFEASRRTAPSGAWTHLEFAADFDLPELTLGIRCSPSVDGVISVVFRDAAIEVDDAG